MTERSELLESYYEELDPAKRRAILASYEETEGADDAVFSSGDSVNMSGIADTVRNDLSTAGLRNANIMLVESLIIDI